MKRATALSYPVSIFIAGDPLRAQYVCRCFCDRVGLCVTVTPTRYVYTDGEEDGVIVGLINYPRFPAEPRQIANTAKELAMELMAELKQQSVSIQMAEETLWLSVRPADLASCDTHPKGGDVEQAPSLMSGAVPSDSEADAQTQPKTHRG